MSTKNDLVRIAERFASDDNRLFANSEQVYIDGGSVQSSPSLFKYFQ